ncbi:polysaccharide pyruvyl transferase family protein, partial [Paratractidigestivibacter sp.]|uniref:polysaccharide pyruvyl transferase family protein n=1 Tax=Paratractidigestivibacter sp. TaxID=2847316 RepID=UPI002ABD24CE
APRTEKGYILVYTVQPPAGLLDAARAKAAETGLEVVYLNNEHRGNRDLRHVRYATPEEFLGWFDGASYVYTNSFHGTVFSIILEKELVVECRTKKKYNSRSKALLELTGLEGREMTETDAGEGTVNWCDVRERLAVAREGSLAYLRGLCVGEGAILDE